MNILTFTEAAIVLLSFAIVGAYLFAVRQFLGKSEGPSCGTTQSANR